MVNMYETIKLLCEREDVSIAQMCQSLGIRQGLISDLKHGRSKSLSGKYLDLIADYFGTTTDYLLGRTGDPENSDRFGLDVPDEETFELSQKESHSSLYDTLSDLCTERGISGYRMCKDVGIQPIIMSDLKMGRRSGLSEESAKKIASYFNISVEFLLAKEENEGTIERAPDSKHLKDTYFRLGKKAQDLNLEINEEDIDAILRIYQIHKKMNETSGG